MINKMITDLNKKINAYNGRMIVLKRVKMPLASAETALLYAETLRDTGSLRSLMPPCPDVAALFLAYGINYRR